MSITVIWLKMKLTAALVLHFVDLINCFLYPYSCSIFTCRELLL